MTLGFALLAIGCAETGAIETETPETLAAPVSTEGSTVEPAPESTGPRAEADSAGPSTTAASVPTTGAADAEPELSSIPPQADPPAEPPIAGPVPDPPVAPALAPTPPPPAPTAPASPVSSSVAPTTAAVTPVVFVGTIAEIDAGTAARMTPASWREGCPVGLDELRLLRLSHWDDDGAVQTGELVVHADHATGVRQAFEALFVAGFPIQRMQLVSDYGGDDQRSMQANNTSAFNCREVAYRPGVWSNHAYGTAVDINPLVNPYVRGDFVDPEAGRPFVDRTRSDVPGMIKPGDVVVEAFGAIGWTWGGTWTNALDYQHFSANGR